MFSTGKPGAVVHIQALMKIDLHTSLYGFAKKNRESKKISLRQYNYDKFIWIVGLLLLRGLKSPERHLWKVPLEIYQL